MAQGILLAEDGDLLILNGSMQIGETKYQNQHHVLLAHPGEVKEYPTVGVGIEDMINDEDMNYWRKEIISGLKSDNTKVISLEINNSGLKIMT